jgi:hypothetical protein
VTNKRYDAVRRSDKMSVGETILGQADAIFTLGAMQSVQKGGYVVQTDQAIYLCVQGMLGLGRTKEVHRLAIKDVLAQKGGMNAVSRDSMEMMFIAAPENLTLGFEMPASADGFPFPVKAVVVSFRTSTEGRRWGGWWDQAVLERRAGAPA